MKMKILAGVALALVFGASYLLLDLEEPTSSKEVSVAAQKSGALVSIDLPEVLSTQAQMGKRAFDAVCASCHGANAVGRDGMGPPLIHKIYEPSHHADFAFLRAVRTGVRAHHWSFGDMPAQEGLTDADVELVTQYIRELQRANGIE
jgi:mono/diheme cytochrome c family protein